jgi:hypothetical protein
MSKTLLGGVEMCEHGLGQQLINTWGGWAGTFGGPAPVGLFNHSITIERDGGAPVYGITTFSGYVAASTISAVGGATWVDGVFQQAWGGEYPGSGSTHWCHTFLWWTGVLAKGAHTINTGAYVYNNPWVFDSNDGGTSMCWEHP